MTETKSKEVQTRWFSFGQNHAHRVNGKTFDADCIVEITSADPRQTMFEHFGAKWAFDYDKPPDMKHFPRGILKL
jgi:hypothetical protein